jgi:uncharacterized protein YuzE/uncharacterized coiled-coil protein SlyX
MKVNEVITKLRVMLGAETEEVIATETRLEEEIKEETEIKMAEAKLVDGTEVYTEGELAVGAILYVKVEEGEAPFASAGMHETEDGMLITVGENGEIVSIEEKAEEAPIAEEATEEVIEEEMEEEKKEEEAFDAEGLIEAIAEMIKPQAEELADMKEKLATLTARFNEVADEPAAKPVKNTFSAEAKDQKSRAEARVDHIISLRKRK